jgi:acyl-coenzyme A synthetase/AMP-(fatty) acid ligase
MIPSNVQLAISAGAPLPLALEAETFARCGLKIHNFYGASECGGIAFDSSSAPREDSTCVGAPMRGVHLSLGADECLCVDSPAVGLCYWPEPDARLGNGRFLTDDLAELKDGQVWLRGRHGDLINVAGRKVSPESIERALAGHAGVKQCIVFGASNADVERGEWIVACLATHSETTIEALKQHLLQQLPAWQLPRDWWIVPELPANQRGKLARSHWRDEYLRTRGQKGQRPGNERLS